MSLSKIASIAIFALVMMDSGYSYADTSVAVPTAPQSPSTPSCVSQSGNFLVSGIMQQKDAKDGPTLRVVHAMVASTTDAEALIKFSEVVALQYPEYTLLDSLVTPANIMAPADIMPRYKNYMRQL